MIFSYCLFKALYWNSFYVHSISMRRRKNMIKLGTLKGGRMKINTSRKSWKLVEVLCKIYLQTDWQTNGPNKLYIGCSCRSFMSLPYPFQIAYRQTIQIIEYSSYRSIRICWWFELFILAKPSWNYCEFQNKAKP